MSVIEERLRAALADRYRIERELGQGGMATVYLAEDLKHKRHVAVKVLKPELAAVLGAERFVQEITTTAALQHPHILPLFDSGTADGFLYYVMPFIDGETLRGKLDRETQLGVDEAVRIASDVAGALDYAHRHGVIHRDIKPENILIHEGRPMVADFGIALAVSAAAGGRMTETGLSLGTPHYMSPEQATAEKEISGRSDIYSLASVLYEMLAGDPPHTGSSAQQIIMKIITEQPAAVTQFRKSVPMNVAAAIAKSLEKLPADRFESAGAFAAALANPAFSLEGVSSSGMGGAAARSWRSWIRDPRSWAAVAAVALLTVALPTVALLAGSRSSEPVATPLRFTVEGPGDSTIIGMLAVRNSGQSLPVISADGRFLAFGTRRSTGSTLYVRRLDSFELREVPGDGREPFFSPDGTALAYLRNAEVWVLNLSDSLPTRLGAVPEVMWDIRSAVWHPDGRILISGARGLWTIPPGGGAETLLVPSASTGRERFGVLDVLADGRILLNLDVDDSLRVEVVAADGSTRRPILPGFEWVRVVDDILFYEQGGQTRATRFDPRRLEPVGSAVTLTDLPTDRVGRSIAWARSGSLADLELVWVSPTGVTTALGFPSGDHRWPRVSADGSRVVVWRESPGEEERRGLRTFSLRNRSSAVFSGGEPVWSADGNSVYASMSNRPLSGIVRWRSDASRAPDTLVTLTRGDAWPTDASADGRWLAYYGATTGAGDEGDATDPNDLFVLDLGSRESRRIRIPGAQRAGRFSPDGRWIAYQSTESGVEEVYVRPWPAMDARYLISNRGGIEPLWAPDGRTLFYRNRNQVMAVPFVARAGAFEPAPPTVLFTGNFSGDPSGDQSWDVAPDGRFLMMRPIPGRRMDIRVALDWISEVRARLARAQ